MLGRRRLRCAYGVGRREALFQTFLTLIVRCFIRFRRFFRVRGVLIEWRWIEFVAHRSLPSNDQSFARLAVPLPRTFCWKVSQRGPIRSEREVWTDRTIEGAARRPALDAAINERPKWTHDAVLFKDHAGTGLL